MRLIPAPPLATPRRAALSAIVLALIVIAVLLQRDLATSLRTLGDTDDAMRLVMVRELLNGKGWFDQHTLRLQPPLGLFPHWSRLIDGGLAALYRLLALVLPPAQAERGMRIVWPLLWIYPAVASGLAIAIRLGQGPQRLEAAARSTVIAAGVVLVTTISLYSQFRPNRIDHHDVQIVFCVLSLLGLAWGGWKGGALAGVATGVGAAIGLEALVFEAVIGAGFAWRFIQSPEDDRQAMKAYGLALAGAAVAAFLAQTPPARWSAAACDAIAYNLLAALVAAGLGIALASALTAKRALPTRLLALAVVGAIAAGLYAGLDSNCLKGPFADVDPRIKPIWLDHVQEVKPWLYQLKRGPDFAFTLMVPTVMGVVAWLWLGFAPGRTAGRRLDPLWLTTGLALLVAGAGLWTVIRVGSYAQWFAAPLIAAALGDLCARYLKGALVGVLALSLATCPAVLVSGVAQANKALTRLAASRKAAARPANRSAPAAKPAPKTAAKAAPAKKAPSPPGCFDIAAWRPLAGVPAGLALSEVDLGPFILAHTRMAALRAPYHRMSYGILKGQEALAAPAEGAAADKTRQLGVAYVVECPSHGRQSDRDGMSKDSLQKRLDAGKPPAWLEVVVKTPTLALYRVLPAPAKP